MLCIYTTLCLKKQILGPLTTQKYLLQSLTIEKWLKRKFIHRIVGISMMLNGEKFKNLDDIIWIFSFSSFFLKHKLQSKPQNWLQNVSTTISITRVLL